jgi:hypothetical protein
VRDQINPLHGPSGSTVVTGGRFHQIRSSAAANASVRPRLTRFSHSLGPKAKKLGMLRWSADQGKPDVCLGTSTAGCDPKPTSTDHAARILRTANPCSALLVLESLMQGIETANLKQGNRKH